MDYIQFITLMTTFIGGFVFIHREIRQEIKEMKEDIKVQSARLDQQAARSDRLYEMFIDLVKTRDHRR
jgi:hypothetical protein